MAVTIGAMRSHHSAPSVSRQQIHGAVMSPLGIETCRLHRAMSAFEGNSEDICSG
jgi:hypothetical protein